MSLQVAYNGVEDLPVTPKHQHLTFNHSTNFVDPEIGAGTNHVEQYRCEREQRFKAMNGTLDEMVPGHLNDFIGRQMFGKSPEEAIVNPFQPRAIFSIW